MTALQNYARRGKDKVKGWFGRIDSQIFCELLEYQNTQGMDGAVAEIGLHHGKSFIALCLGLKPGQRAYGIDIFEAQELNYDSSGHGDRQRVEKNLAHFGADSNNCLLDGRSSDQVTPENILDQVGPVRFFSIDGGHWLELTASDLKLAGQVLSDDGIMVQDDYFQPAYPEVAGGFHAWYSRSDGEIVPFAIGFNKVYLCRRDRVAQYRAVLEASPFLKFFLRKRYRFLGQDVPIFRDYPMPDWRLSRRLRHYLRFYHPDFYVRLRRLFPQTNTN